MKVENIKNYPILELAAIAELVIRGLSLLAWFV
jgi:hypothetical protein